MSLRDCVAEGHIDIGRGAEAAQCRKAHSQAAPNVGQRPQSERALQFLSFREPVVGNGATGRVHVHMDIDKARYHRAVARIDDLGLRRQR